MKAKHTLKETAKEYIEKYPARLAYFLNEFEASEIDYVKEEIEYFEATIYDLENARSSCEGFSTTGIANFLMAEGLAESIGWGKLKYATKRKIEFLESKKNYPQSTDWYPPESLSPEPTKTKSDNDLPKQLIVFNKPETINEFHSILKGFFIDRETDLLKALQGEQLENALLFTNN